MKRIVLGIILFLIAGCTVHYQRIQNDRVNLFVTVSGASEVYFASSVDGFRLHPAQKTLWGAWKVDAPASGEFTYFYRVDGSVWVPECKSKETDDFGSQNCIFTPSSR